MAKQKHKEDKWIVLCLIIALLAMSVFLLIRCGVLEPQDPWQEQYDLGIRFLNEGNYEEAVLSFLAAIDIDPKRTPAYTGAAEAYVALGDYEAAIEILEAGIENTGDEDLEEELEELKEELQEEDLLPTEEPEKPAEPVVMDAYSDYYEIGTNMNGDPITTCYHIPQILLADGSSAQANEAIYQELYGILQDDVYAYGEEAYNSMRYQWNMKGDYISVITQISYFGSFDWTYHKVYLISASTGELLDHLELLNAYGHTEETYYAAVSERLAGYFEAYENLREMVGDAQYNSVVSDTLADENLRKAIPFVGENGELCILAYVYWPAGAGAYWHVMSLEGTEGFCNFSCKSGHGTAVQETEEETAVAELQDICQMVADYYNQNMEYRYEGEFVAFEGEASESGNECYVIVRFQHSEDDPTIGANLLVAQVVVDKTTGEMTVDGEYLDDLW